MTMSKTMGEASVENETDGKRRDGEDGIDEDVVENDRNETVDLEDEGTVSPNR